MTVLNIGIQIVNQHQLIIEDCVKHLDNFWSRGNKEYLTWDLGPVRAIMPWLRICRVNLATEGGGWVYASLGASAALIPDESYRIEFVLMTPYENPRHVETVAMVAWDHFTTGRKFDEGRILNVGRPWLDDSTCDHLLVSLPYPFGPSLEWCRRTPLVNVRFLWLLPITSSEAAYARANGVESLEEIFDQEQINFIDPQRKSVV